MSSTSNNKEDLRQSVMTVSQVLREAYEFVTSLKTSELGTLPRLKPFRRDKRKGAD